MQALFFQGRDFFAGIIFACILPRSVLQYIPNMRHARKSMQKRGKAMYCEFCGKPVSDYAKYCRFCGKTLEYYKTEPLPEPPKPNELGEIKEDKED